MNQASKCKREQTTTTTAAAAAAVVVVEAVAMWRKPLKMCTWHMKWNRVSEHEKEARGMKHRNKFQSSKLLVVWLVFLSLRFSFSHLILYMFPAALLLLLLFSVCSFYSFASISFALPYRRIYSYLYASLSNFFFFFFFALRNILALNRMCAFVSAIQYSVVVFVCVCASAVVFFLL